MSRRAGGLRGLGWSVLGQEVSKTGNCDLRGYKEVSGSHDASPSRPPGPPQSATGI